ncbi:MAG TPA: response regulator [Elusimicrobiales bacterium]|nr:response regulator [Elusimicrobiales bacterium]HOL62798.1 response regulator [Elusimicrobiales bacterium]HPO96272.1 response regulator [Elusimicrobiales bacterium]
MNKIMIIDDEKDVLFLLKVLIEKEGYQAIQASNGLEAYNKLTDASNPIKPDVIVLDIMMPEMDGYTFQTKLQQIEELRNIPIIILTAKGQTKDLFEMASNVYSFVEKPFDPKNLLNTIKGAIEYGNKNNT